MNCVLFATTVILDGVMEERDIVDYLGHRGTKKVGEYERGFHIQEILRLLEHCGYSAMPFEVSPVSEWPNGTKLGVIIGGPDTYSINSNFFRKQGWANYMSVLNRSELALVEGVSTRGVPHMIAKVGNRFYDQRGSHDFEDFVESGFRPLTVWKVNKVTE